MAQGDSHTEYIIHVVSEDYENTYYGYTEFSLALHDAENWYGKDGRDGKEFSEYYLLAAKG